MNVQEFHDGRGWCRSVTANLTYERCEVYGPISVYNLSFPHSSVQKLPFLLMPIPQLSRFSYQSIRKLGQH